MTTTLLASRLETAARCMAAFSSTVEANSSTTQLVDSTLLENASSPDSFAGGFVYRPDATAAGDRLRALPTEGSFNTQGSALVPIRAWANAPVEGETYHFFALLAPTASPGQAETWTRIVNRALGSLYGVTEIVVGSGGSGSRNFPIAPPAVTLIAAVLVAGGSGATVTPPTGWSTVVAVNLSTTIRLVVLSKRLKHDDPIEWNVTFDSARVATAIVTGYVDANPTSPADTTASTTASAATSIAAPTVTTAASLERVLRIVAGSAAAAFTGPTTLERRADAVLEDGNRQQGLALFDGIVSTAGDAGAATITPSTATNMIAVTVALAPRTTTQRTVYAGHVVVGTDSSGDSTLALRRPPNLPSDEWAPNKQSIRKVMVRRFTGSAAGDGAVIYEWDMNRGGRTWDYKPNGSIELSMIPTALDQVVLEVQRPYAPLVSDDDETDCNLDRLVLRARYEAYLALNGAPATRGKYAAELAQALQEWQAEERYHAPQQVIRRP